MGCSARFVQKNHLAKIEQSYSGLYSLKKNTDIGNNKDWPQGKIIKIYMRAKSDAIMVYAFDSKLAREQAIGKNILILLQNDFEDGIFDKALLIKKLDDLLQPVIIK